ncbi:MAG: DNA-binding response regulator [Rhodocyclaceae bacterium]|nr:MAG: DNA-binding response regulator [Rhodocyclaceae bacterium]
MQEDRHTPFALIVEDHPLVADSLIACVRDCDPGLEVNTAESLRAALHILARRPAPLLIVTDLTLTDSQGTEAVGRLRQAAPETPILVFTALDDPALRSEAKELGAIGYLIKSTSIQTLRDEIRAVIAKHPTGQRIPAAGAGKLSRLLTPKQIAVVEELMAGRSNKQIAARLNLSDETVGSHMKEILSRLGARNRTEAVVRYLQEINPPHDRPKG